METVDADNVAKKFFLIFTFCVLGFSGAAVLYAL